MNTWQKRVDAWIAMHKDGYWPPKDIMLRLMEEVGELSREVNHVCGPKKKKDSEDAGSIAGEVGDILFTLVCLCNRLGIDMNEVFNMTIQKCYGRDAQRFEKK